MRFVVVFWLCLIGMLPSVAFCQASGVGVEVVVCVPESDAIADSEVTYKSKALSCGTDANGKQLVPQVSSLMVAMNASPQQPVEGGEQVGVDIGAAVLLVLSVAFSFRSIRNMLNSSSEG